MLNLKQNVSISTAVDVEIYKVNFYIPFVKQMEVC